MRARVPVVQGLLVGDLFEESEHRGAGDGVAGPGDQGGTGAQDSAGNNFDGI